MVSIDDLKTLLEEREVKLARDMEEANEESMAAGNNRSMNVSDYSKEVEVVSFLMAESAIGKRIKINEEGETFPMMKGDRLVVKTDIVSDPKPWEEPHVTITGGRPADIVVAGVWFDIDGSLLLSIVNVTSKVIVLNIGDTIGTFSLLDRSKLTN